VSLGSPPPVHSRAGPAPVHPLVRVLPPTPDGQAVVALHGDIDIAARSPLLDVRTWLDEQHLTPVVDASQVTFLDCAGWAAVCSLVPRGCEPLLRRPSPAVQHLIAVLAKMEDLPGIAGRVAGEVQGAMGSLAVIDQAEGVLMAQEGLTAGEASAHLSSISQAQRRPLREVAQEVLSQALRRTSDSATGTG
jgi:anti-anti-sigma regulatory factor